MYDVLRDSAFIVHKYNAKHFNIAVANSRSRETLSRRYIAVGFNTIDLVTSNTTIYDQVSIGEGSIVCSNSIITSNISIGRFFHCNLMSYVAHDCIIGDYVTFAPRVTCCGNVIIEDHAYIGACVVIKQGRSEHPLRIGAGAVIGMVAVVTQNVPPNEVWVGSPARRRRSNIN